MVFNGDGNHPDAGVRLSQNIGFRASDTQATMRNIAFAPDGTVRPIIQREYYKGAVAAMAVVPNPFTSSFVLVLESIRGGEVDVQVFNSVGQSIYRTEDILLKGSNKLEISTLAHFPEGVYFICVNSGGDSIVGKVVKKS